MWVNFHQRFRNSFGREGRELGLVGCRRARFDELMFLQTKGSFGWEEGVCKLFSLLFIGGCRCSVRFFEGRYSLTAIVRRVCFHVLVDRPYVFTINVVDPVLPVVSLGRLNCLCEFLAYCLLVLLVLGIPECSPIVVRST